MTHSRIRLIVAYVWSSVIVGLVGIGVILGVSPTLPGMLMVFLLGCIPMMVLFRVFLGAPPRTVAEILYATDHPPQGR